MSDNIKPNTDDTTNIESESVKVLREIVELKAKGEHRSQQEAMVEEIESAIANNNHVLVQAPTGSGKALDITTPILTINGWSTMGDLKVGDVIFDESGQKTKITHVYPFLENRKTYEVIFNDGSRLVADAEHLWATSNHVDRNKMRATKSSDPKLNITKNTLNNFRASLEKDTNFWASNPTVNPLSVSRSHKIPYAITLEAARHLSPVMTKLSAKQYNTRELFEQIYIASLNVNHISMENSFNLKTNTTEQLRQTLTYKGHTNHAIPVVSAPLDFNEQDLLIDPYILGAWLGDDKDLSIKQDFSTTINELISNGLDESFTGNLRKMNVVNNKHIPEKYLMSSEDQRRGLLAGLLDTNGSISKNGDVELYASNSTLAANVHQLVNSLGYKAKTQSKQPKISVKGKTYQHVYTVSFTTDPTDSKNNLRYIIEINEIASVTVRCITVDSPSHLFLAGTSLIPTHNSMGYLIPVLQSGKRAVISTATKQLSEQIVNTELPFLQKSLMKTHPEYVANDFTLLKGRDNYLCLKKLDDQHRLNTQAERESKAQLSLFAEEASTTAKAIGNEIKTISDWADTTRSGDRSEAPAVSDKTWKQFSVTTTECPGRSNCPFGKECFAEKARDKAKEAQIVVTNHAVVANDLVSEGSMVGDRDVLVFDELHELDGYLSNAWGANITIKSLKDAVREFKKANEISDTTISGFDEAIDNLEPYFTGAKNGLIENVTAGFIDSLKAINKYSAAVASTFQKSLQGKDAVTSKKEILGSLKKRADAITEATNLLLDNSIETVRWFNVPSDTTFVKKGEEKKEKITTLNAAPLRVGPKLIDAVNSRGMVMIGTSATITVAGSFEIPVHNLALDTQSTHKTLAVESPFDFQKQAMLYIPDTNIFPAPVGADRKAHSEAILDEAVDLIRAAGGRTLALSTTSYGASQWAKYFRQALKKDKIKILLQGEAPQAQLVEEFRNDETSVLVATMGLWHGLDVQGSALSVVIIDKIPFKPMDDPLSVSRQKYAESKGRNGFMDVYVADANIMLAQGAGRLVRHTEDKGVVAILDTRLLSKPYGRSMLKSLPPMKLFNKKEIVIAALKRLTGNDKK